MWRYDYTSKYIIEHVNASRQDPGLNLYHGNTTECSMESNIVQSLMEASTGQLKSPTSQTQYFSVQTKASARGSGGTAGAGATPRNPNAHGRLTATDRSGMLGMAAWALLSWYCVRAITKQAAQRSTARGKVLESSSRAAGKLRVQGSLNEQRNNANI